MDVGALDLIRARFRRSRRPRSWDVIWRRFRVHRVLPAFLHKKQTSKPPRRKFSLLPALLRATSSFVCLLVAISSAFHLWTSRFQEDNPKDWIYFVFNGTVEFSVLSYVQQQNVTITCKNKREHLYVIAVEWNLIICTEKPKSEVEQNEPIGEIKR